MFPDELNLNFCIEPNNSEGPYIYKLSSVIVHNGSSEEGHYYVYAKDFETNQWLCFNDSIITYVNPTYININ